MFISERFHSQTYTVYLHTEARQYTAECGGKLVISGIGVVTISVQRTQPTALVVHSEG